MEPTKTITTQELEKELQALDPRIVIAPNHNRPGASNVFLNGTDIMPWIPSAIVQEEATPDYFYTLPNGSKAPFKTAPEVREYVKTIIDKLKEPEFVEMLFDTTINEDHGVQYK